VSLTKLCFRCRK